MHKALYHCKQCSLVVYVQTNARETLNPHHPDRLVLAVVLITASVAFSHS